MVKKLPTELPYNRFEEELILFLKALRHWKLEQFGGFAPLFG